MNLNDPEVRRKLLFGIALCCGALALVLLYSYVTGQQEKSRQAVEQMKQEMASRQQQAPQNMQVLVAARPISQGAVIGTEDIAVREMPKDFVLQGAIPPNINIVGLTALSPIGIGEQFMQSKIGRPEKPKLLSQLTPPGKRAVQVSIDNSLAGLVQPGDYVDVLALINPPEGSPLYALASVSDKTGSKSDRIVTIPLFQNVLVLSVGSDAKDKKSAGMGGETLTLSLSPQEAALIAFVQEQGKIKLSMRSNNDTGSDSSIQTVNWDSLFEYLYPGSRERGMRKPATVEIYRGLQKEVVPLEGQTK